MTTAQYTYVGKPIGRVEGPEKVTGAAHYPADVLIPGTLWCKALRSPMPHARIRSIDTSRAKQLPGVHAVITAADVSESLMGRRMLDMPILARGKVRFIGEKVAVVAADDADIAEEATLLIDVDYEELPAVSDLLEALGPDSPILHDNINGYQGLPKPVEEPTNHFSRLSWSLGDVDQGFAESDFVFEHQFSFPMAHQAYLEPHAVLMHIDEQGRVQIWVNNKAPHGLIRQCATAWGIDPASVRVNVTNIGGDFGGKGDFMDVPVIYYLAKATGRPVRMVMSYMEEFLAGNPRHPGIITIKTGLKRDGSIHARYARALYDSGAYAAFKPGVNLAGSTHLAGSYRIPNVLIYSDCVYTNTVPRGHARAPGGPQAIYASESHLDMIAQEIGMDPMELRLKNVLQDGDVSGIGKKFVDIRGEQTLRAAAEAADYGAPKAPYVGRGISVYDREAGQGESNATIIVDPNGEVTMLSPSFDTGTGTHTILAQILAEELTIPISSVHVRPADTDSVPFDSGVGGSRVSNVAGQAGLRAVREVRTRMTEVAGDLMESPPEKIQLQNGQFIAQGEAGRAIPFAEVAARAAETGGPIHVQTLYKPEGPENVTAFLVAIVEVQVDPETGQVTVDRITSAADTGTVLNPIGHRGQIVGGAIQGLGYALMEEMPVEEGRVETVHFGDYKIPTMPDIPKLTEVTLDDPSGPTPYQGKAVGELSNCTMAAAVANAVADAVGVRITDLPITAEKVRAALKAKQQ